jgi:DNA-binding XRE family transcriptional regulator
MQHKVFNQHTFYDQFFKDLHSSRALCLIQSPYITLRQVEEYRDTLRTCVHRGVRVCIFAQKPRQDASQDYRRQFNDAVNLLRSWGAHVSIKPKIHEKLVIVDHNIFWDGSLNPLSHWDTKERMTRWVSDIKVAEALISHKLDSCESCASRPGFQLLNLDPDSLMKLDGQCIARYRKTLGLSQEALARKLGIRRKVISQLEHGLQDIQLSTLKRIYSALGLTLVRVPWYLVPAVADFVAAKSEGANGPVLGVKNWRFPDP